MKRTFAAVKWTRRFPCWIQLTLWKTSVLLTVSLSSPVEGESALNDSTPYFYYKTGSPDPFYVFNNYEGGVAENGIYFSLAWFADNLGLALKDGGSHGYYAEYDSLGRMHGVMLPIMPIGSIPFRKTLPCALSIFRFRDRTRLMKSM